MQVKLKLVEPATFMTQAWFELLEDIEVDGILIPEGQRTDGATLPRWVVYTALLLILFSYVYGGILSHFLFSFGFLSIFLAYIFPAFGTYALAALLHDKLLDDGLGHEADKRMLVALSSMGINGGRAKLMYKLVSLNSYVKRKLSFAS